MLFGSDFGRRAVTPDGLVNDLGKDPALRFPGADCRREQLAAEVRQRCKALSCQSFGSLRHRAPRHSIDRLILGASDHIAGDGSGIEQAPERGQACRHQNVAVDHGNPQVVWFRAQRIEDVAEIENIAPGRGAFRRKPRGEGNAMEFNPITVQHFCDRNAFDQRRSDIAEQGEPLARIGDPGRREQGDQAAPVNCLDPRIGGITPGGRKHGAFMRRVDDEAGCQ